MSEQSHKQAMAEALRGDFARLRARGVASTLTPTEAAGAPTAPSQPAAAAPAPAVPEPETPAASSWLERFLSAR